MSSNQIRQSRINREILELSKTDYKFVCEDHLFVELKGELGTVYENMRFLLSVDFPAVYPMEPPLVLFVTRIYHPNIDEYGNVCVDFLKCRPKGSWNPSWSLFRIFQGILQLMKYPNPDDPLNSYIAREMVLNNEEFECKAKIFYKVRNEEILVRFDSGRV